MDVIDNGKIRKAEDVQLADEVIAATKKGIWETIDVLVNAWARRAPDEVKAMKVQIKEYRENLSDPIFGQTNERLMDFRFTLSFPIELQSMIRAIYTPQEVPFSKKFYATFAKKYPFFMIPDKI